MARSAALERRAAELAELQTFVTQLSVQWYQQREKHATAATRPTSGANSKFLLSKVGAGKAVHQQTPAERSAAMIAAAEAGKPVQPATMTREVEIDVR